jgi:hypothetical protein
LAAVICLTNNTRLNNKNTTATHNNTRLLLKETPKGISSIPIKRNKNGTILFITDNLKR